MKVIVGSVGFALGMLLAFARPAAALDSGVEVTLNTWHAGAGHAYVGVQAAGEWAPPDTRSCNRYWSAWDHRTTIDTQPVRDQWSVKVHTCSGSVVNPAQPDDGNHEPHEPWHRDPA